MAILPEDIPTGKVTGQFYFVNEDTIEDPDQYPQLTVVTGFVRFKASIKVLRMSARKAVVIPLTFDAKFNSEGKLVPADHLDSPEGIYLPATDSTEFDTTGWTWTATFEIKDADTGHTIQIDPITFQVPVGSELDLSTIVPAPASPGVITTRGPQGIQGPKGDKGDKGDIGPSPTDPLVAGYLSDPESESRSALSAAIDDRLGSASIGLQVVYHGDDEAFPRPNYISAILWIGSVVPLNRVGGDQYFVASAEPVPYNPLTLGPVMWYDASDLATGLLGTWADKTGNGYMLTAVSGSGATVTANAIGTNKAAVFDGTTHYTTPTITHPFTDQDATVVIVGYASTATTTQNFVGGNTATDTARFEVGKNGSNAWFAARGTAQRTAVATNDGTPKVIFAEFGDGEGATILEVNGEEWIKAVTDRTGLNSMLVGARSRTDSVGAKLDGGIGELFVFNRKLTGAEKAGLLAHLAEKWSV